MRTRRLGRTGLEVSEMVFGGGFVGGIVIHADDATKRQALRRALDAGVTMIDTAPRYGQGQSEEALGWLLDEIDDTPILSTKVRLDLADLSDIPGQIEASIKASLTRLRRTSVELLQLHNPIAAATSDAAIGIDHVLGPDGVADGLERVRNAGLTRFVGLTALGEPTAIREVIGSSRFDTAQVYYNLLNPSAGQDMPAAWSGHDFPGVIEACRAQDMGVMNIRVFAAGVIIRHGREIVITEASTVALEAQRARAVFAALGDEFGSRAQTAIRFSLAEDAISCVVVGLAELAHIDEALGGFTAGPLPPAAIKRLRLVYAGNFSLD